MDKELFVISYPALKIPDLSDEGILNWLSYQPRSDYRKPIKVEKLPNKFAVKVTFEVSAPTTDTTLLEGGK